MISINKLNLTAADGSASEYDIVPMPVDETTP